MIRILLLFACLATVAAISPRVAVDDLVEQELQFAATAKQKGTRHAFLAYLAENSIVFRPLPVPARKWYEKQPDANSLLEWEPAYAEASGSGDIGFTTGPWQFRKTASEPAGAFGQFVSVWQRPRDGEWRVVLDAGCNTPGPHSFFKTKRIEKRQHNSRISARHSQKLFERETELATEISKQGPAALLTFFTKDGFLLRENEFPVRGIDAIGKKLTGMSEWSSTRVGGATSQNDDLGYTFGTCHWMDAGGKPQKGTYLRVWRNEGSWKLVLDLTTPAK